MSASEHVSKRRKVSNSSSSSSSASVATASSVALFADDNPRRERLGLHAACRSVEHFEQLNVIDEGTFGVVFRAKDKATGELVALKQVKLDPSWEGFPAYQLREIDILLQNQHPNICELREIVVGAKAYNVFMVMEYMDHDLSVLLRSMERNFLGSQVKYLLKQLLQAVAFLHKNWILHRDIKPANILFNNTGELKLCDFGLARAYSQPDIRMTPLVISRWYRPPELFLGEETYSSGVDMWSVGCVFAELVSGKPLMPGATDMKMLSLMFDLLGTPTDEAWPGFKELPQCQKFNFKKQPINRLRERFPVQNFTGTFVLSDAGFDLLSQMLAYDPARRISAADALHHRFFREEPLPAQASEMPNYKELSASARQAASEKLEAYAQELNK